MSKLVLLALLLTAGCRYATGKWPWQLWQEWQRPPAISQALRLLGLADGASRADILDAHRRLIVAVHPDKGGTEALVHEANAARDLLLARLGEANRVGKA
jgi:DnaJ family protein C protein 19